MASEDSIWPVNLIREENKIRLKWLLGIERHPIEFMTV